MKEYKPPNNPTPPEDLQGGFKVNLPEENTTGKKRKKRKNRWGRTFVMLFAILGLSFFLAYYLLVSASDLLGLEKPDQQIEVVIPEGMGLTQITDLLSDQNIVMQPVTFHLYAALKGNQNKLKSGTYILNSNMSYDQILSALKSGNATKETVTLTFYEGMTIREVAQKLEKAKVCSSSEFITALQGEDFSYAFMDRLTDDPLRYHKYEGYIFPDTYEFYVDMNPTSVVKKFLSNFDNKMTDEIYAKMKNKGITLNELITLASVIQEEASDSENMPLVASVLQNRLENRQEYPRLQCDVTIFYVEKDIKPFLTTQKQTMYDAYNTYVCEGLPIGPICNPGMAAIEAALEPETTEYYFFLTDADGKYYYAKTANEHYKNNSIAAKIGETHGTATQ